MQGNILLIGCVFFPFAGALISYLIGYKSKKGRDYAARIIAVVEMVLCVGLLFSESTTADINAFAGLGLHFSMSFFWGIQSILASGMWFAALVFSRDYMKAERNRNRYYFYLLLTLGTVLGIFLSADLFTAFLFFELMSFTSFVWVIQRETGEAVSAAKTYLAAGVTAGLVMLMGLFLLYTIAGTLRFDALGQACMAAENKQGIYLAGCCLLIGFGTKAGMFALHIWLPGAYTQSPAPASALFSGMLSKTGIYGILMLTISIFASDRFWGAAIVSLGLLTMAAGAVLALFSVSFKRVLACSSMSQIGFILTGIGMISLLGKDSETALAGSALHMVNHSLIKLLLFIIAGVVFLNTGKYHLNEIRGWGYRKPFLRLIYLSAAFGITGIPLFNGYVSKTLIHESIAEAIQAGILPGGFLPAAEWIFMICSGFTVAYMMKIGIALFAEKNTDAGLQKEYENKSAYLSRATAVLLAVTACMLPAIGICGIFMMQDRLVNLESFLNTVISVGIGVIIYLVIVRGWMMRREGAVKSYLDKWPVWWNAERVLYRPIFRNIFPEIAVFFCRIGDTFADGIVVLLRRTILKDASLPLELEEGTRMTCLMGTFLNKVFCFMAYFKGKKQEKDYVHKLAVWYEEKVEDSYIISRSLSFGLFMFCIGLCATLIYILIV